MTAEEILKSKNITPNTKHHNYEYLYRSMVDAMNEYASQQRTEGIREGVTTPLPKCKCGQNSLPYKAQIDIDKCGRCGNEIAHIH